MAGAADRTLLALDQNFPIPIVTALSEFMTDFSLTPLRDIDPELARLDDRQLMLALRQEGFDWLITNNYRMLLNPRELAAVMKAHMKVFAIQGAGGDPLRATGAMLLDLPGALKQAVAGRSQVFWSRPRNPNPREPWELFTRAAEHRHEQASELYEEVKVSDQEAGTPWRDALA